ncbi:MAG: AAA family ATPase [Sedimentisphaerales bacterium]|nr:AAA family ATPase [Sedimentisphaerales bacterium]
MDNEKIPLKIKTENNANQPAGHLKPERQMTELEVLVRARYPLIYVVSWEEQRLSALVARIAQRLDKRVFEWSITTGLVPMGTSIQSQKHCDSASKDPLVALDTVVEHAESALYLFKDFHPFLKGQNMAIVRRLREIAASLKHTYKTIVIISPMFQMPAELEKDLTIVDFDLPSEKEFNVLLDRIIEEVKDNPRLNVTLNQVRREQIVHALLGLTLAEAENVLAKTLVQYRSLGDTSLPVIHNEKKQIIRKNGLLEYFDSNESIDSIGGLDELKMWLTKRAVAFSDQAREYGLPAPKGVLLLGVQGCGKSLSAKAMSNILQLPLLRFDVGRLFGSLVGSSEENVRRAIKVAESVAPVVIWVDEIDKAFRGSRGSSASTDGGTSARVFGTFLTWMSEKTKPVFVVATANDVTQLPPELLRKGRFDETFFIDLPSWLERKEIFQVHLARRGIKFSDTELDRLAESSNGFSGAEIEEAIISTLFDIFYDKQEMSAQKLLQNIQKAVPLSKMMSEDIDRLRKWAEGRARFATSEKYSVKPDADKRKIEI